MRKLREVLLNQSIGAIAIGFILAQAAGAVVSASMQAIMFYLQPRRDSVFFTEKRVFPWGNITLPVISLVLYCVTAYLLLYWLYLRNEDRTAARSAEDEKGTQQ